MVGKKIKILTGQDIQHEWHYQFLEDSENIKSLANRINDFFISVTDHLQPLPPPVSSVHVPTGLLVTEEEVYQSPSSIDINKAVGPDNIPNKLLKDFSYELNGFLLSWLIVGKQ